MSENYISGEALKEFWKTKKFEKVKKYNSREEVEEKVKEIALTYYDEITPLESDGSKDYRPELEFLDYCFSATHGWDLAFASMALLNFTESISETFNIEDEGCIEDCLDNKSIKTEEIFEMLVDLIFKVTSE